MILQDLLIRLPLQKTYGNLDVTVPSLCLDSRDVTEGALFAAITGTNINGHDFIEQAIQNGASIILCESLPELQNPRITYILVKDSMMALGKIASNFYGNPTKKLKLIGVTGTNGKTTTTTLLHHLLAKLNKKSALISTINIQIGNKTIVSTHTTPDIIKINKILKEAVDNGCEYAIMEVSSHGVHQQRIAGLDFAIAGFTNITHDHLDYHKTFRNYISAKQKFFDDLSKESIAITNIDDKNGHVIVQNSKAIQKTYALQNIADYKGKVIESRLDGMLLNINNTEFWTNLTGTFNAYNLLLVYGIAESLGFNKNEILMNLSELKTVEGRFETSFTSQGQCIIVDYAHTPYALENVINTINDLRTKNEKLVVVVGCGGNRDKAKRPLMAKMATEKAELTILTSDNPRDENPDQILLDMEEGIEAENFKKYLKISDRKEAIEKALNKTQKGDIILIAGKGHENYQEINGVKRDFDDKKIALELSEKIYG